MAIKKNCPECKHERREYGVKYCPECYKNGGNELDAYEQLNILKVAYKRDFSREMPDHLVHETLKMLMADEN